MKKAKNAIVLATLMMGSFSVAEAAMEVTNVKRKYISIKDNKKLTIKTSDILSIYDNGEKTGEARVLKVKGKKAQAYLLDGEVEEGLILRMKTDDEEDMDTADNSSNSPFSRGKKISSRSRRSKRSGKAFSIESGILRDAIGVTNIKANYRISNATTFGLGFYKYGIEMGTTVEYDGETVQEDTIEITGNTFSVIGTTWLNGTAYTDGAFLRGEAGYTKLKVDTKDTFVDFDGIDLRSGAKGIQVFGDIGYHWQWQNFYTNIYAGLQYLNMSAEATATDGVNTASAQDDLTATGLDLGFMMGVAF